MVRTWKEEGRYKKSRACFYVDDGLVENNNQGELQEDINRMIELFERMGLHANEQKTKFMIVRGASAPRALEKGAYDRRWRREKVKKRWGEGKYESWRRREAECRICGKTITNGAMKRHLMSQHGVGDETYLCREIQDRGTYEIKFKKNRFNKCPVEGCSGGGKDKFGLYRHFCGRHPGAEIKIEEDGWLPKCQQCGMRMADPKKHEGSVTCKKLGGEEREREEAR